tara:strand:+ start:433 stop:612 length:180 start_codon:yes stop_codon:yes gene_type:complete
MDKIILPIFAILIVAVLSTAIYLVITARKKNKLRPCSEYSDQQSCPKECSWKNNQCKAS